MGISHRTLVRPWAVLAIAMMLMTVASAVASAAQRPVKDDAGFFSPAAISQAESQLQKLQQEYHRTVIVETFGDLPPELRGQVDGNDASKKAAYESFVQSRSYSLGADLYVMATKSPGHLETYARSTARSGLTRDGYQRMRTELLAAFKAKQFDQGLTSFADSMLVTAQSGPAANANTNANTGGAASNVPQPRSESQNAPVPAQRSGGSGLFGLGGCMTIVIVIGVVLIAVRIIRGLFGPRNPPPLPPGGYGQPGQPGYGQQGYGQQGGMMGQGGGGFGRGLLGGVLGGLLGGYAGNQVFGQHNNDSSNTGGDPNAGGGDFSSGGNDSGSNDLGAGGGDFGGGDTGGGGDSGGGGGDF